MYFRAIIRKELQRVGDVGATPETAIERPETATELLSGRQRRRADRQPGQCSVSEIAAWYSDSDSSPATYSRPHSGSRKTMYSTSPSASRAVGIDR